MAPIKRFLPFLSLPTNYLFFVRINPTAEAAEGEIELLRLIGKGYYRRRSGSLTLVRQKFGGKEKEVWGGGVCSDCVERGIHVGVVVCQGATAGGMQYNISLGTGYVKNTHC